jgi:CDP-glycerol glycerophosphotransferase
MKNRKLDKSIREGITAFRETAISLLSWLIGYPLSLIIKRDINLTVVIIRAGSMYADNSKYFFVYANEIIKPDERIVLLTSDRHLRDLIAKAGGEAIRHPTLRSLFILLRCGTVVTDLLVYGYYPFIMSARFVQIWHGAPLKHIELDLYNKRLAGSSYLLRLILRIQKLIIGRYPTYDIVVSTSQKFIQEAFQSCFKARQFVATGYPRNDILFGWPKTSSLAWHLAWINVDKQAMELVEKAKSDGKTICLYAPTYRKSLSNPFESVIDLAGLSEFARQNNILIVLKLHPMMHGRYEFSRYPNLLAYESHSDVYPLMAICDILITDYSSIYFDYLLLDRPIIFFAYDLESYLREDSGMYFDYESMTPGAKCRNQKELENHLTNIISREFEDGYAVMRKKIKSFTHDHNDNQSCRRLIQEYLLINK